MVELPLPALLAMFGSLGVTMVSAAWLWADARLTTNTLRSERSRADHFEKQWRAANEQLARAEQEALADREHRETLVVQHQRLKARLQSQDDDQAKLEARLLAVRSDLDDSARRLSSSRSEIERLKERVRELGADKERAARALRDRDAIFRSLDVHLDGHAPEPTAPEARLRTRSLLRDLLTSSGADAVALANTRGLAALTAGSADGAAQLASHTVIADQLVPALSAALCAPVTAVELATSRSVLAYRRLSGTPWWLGLTTQSETPRAQLDLAVLRLLGRADRPDPVPELPEVLPDFPVSSGPDARAERWCARWGVESVALVEASGAPHCLAGDLDNGAAWSLRRAMVPLRRRLQRDGWPLTTASVRGRSPDGMTIEARWLSEGDDAPIMIARSVAALPDHATSELGDVLRWALSEPSQQAL